MNYKKNLSFPRGNPENLCTSSNKNRYNDDW